MKLTVLLFCVLLLTACSGEDEPELSTEPLEVDVLNDETAAAGDEVTLQIEVSQDSQAVEDANEVVIEVWTDGAKENSVMIPAEHSGDGIYEADFTYEETTVYYVQPHVTARGLHSMPVHEVDVESN